MHVILDEAIHFNDLNIENHYIIRTGKLRGENYLEYTRHFLLEIEHDNYIWVPLNLDYDKSNYFRIQKDIVLKNIKEGLKSGYKYQAFEDAKSFFEEIVKLLGSVE